MPNFGIFSTAKNIIDWLTNGFGSDGSDNEDDSVDFVSGSSKVPSSKNTLTDNPLWQFKYIKDLVKNLYSGDNFQDASLNAGISGTNSANGISSSTGTNSDLDLMSYLTGLFTTQKEENELNREFNSAEAGYNRDFQASQAQIQRDWYEYMSNTAYQRSMADMKAAGLNPILAYSQGGAASSATGIPAGSAAAYTATGGDSFSSLMSSAADLINAVRGSSGSTISSVNLAKYIDVIKRLV